MSANTIKMMVIIYTIFLSLFLLFFWRFYLFIFREGKGGRKRGKQTSMCGCLSCTPYCGPGPQLRHMPWLGIEPVTLWFTGTCSIHWAAPARAQISFPWKFFNTSYLLMVYIYNMVKWPLYQAIFFSRKVCYKRQNKYWILYTYTEKVMKTVTNLPSSLVACCFTRVIGDLAGGLLSGWRQLLAVLVSPSILWLQNKNGGQKNSFS